MTIRVCAISDVECSRGCGTGACKKEGKAMNETMKEGERAHAQWESSAIANELWQLADQCGYGQFRSALSNHIKQAYQDGWQDCKAGVASVTYGDAK